MAMTLKAARVNVGLSQKDASKALGVSERTLWSWENGKTAPTTKVITEIEKLYGVNYSELIFLPQKCN